MSFFGQDQIARSTEEISHRISGLGRELSRLAGDVTHSASRDVGQVSHDWLRLARKQAPLMARIARQQARRASRAVGRDPVPTLVAVAGIACLASLALARRKS